MAYVRKTHDEWRIEGMCCGGWSVECYAEDAQDAKRLLREYRQNCPGTGFRIKKVRVPNTKEA